MSILEKCRLPGVGLTLFHMVVQQVAASPSGALTARPSPVGDVVASLSTVALNLLLV